MRHLYDAIAIFILASKVVVTISSTALLISTENDIIISISNLYLFSNLYLVFIHKIDT